MHQRLLERGPGLEGVHCENRVSESKEEVREREPARRRLREEGGMRPRACPLLLLAAA